VLEYMAIGTISGTGTTRMTARPNRSSTFTDWMLWQPTTKRDRERKDRRITVDWMDAARRKYEASGNPVHAWEAYWLARKAHVPVPTSVLLYLDRVSASVSALARHTVPRQGQQAKAIYQALEFKRPGRTGATNPLRAIVDQGHRAEVASHVYITLLAVGKPDLAFDTVVKEHPKRCDRCGTISRRTVIRYYREFETLFRRLPTAKSR
jgi:hypothetical protein